MIAFVDIDCLRATAFACRHSVEAVILRGTFAGRVCVANPQGTVTAFCPDHPKVSRRRARHRAEMALRGLRASDYYRWTVAPPALSEGTTEDTEDTEKEGGIRRVDSGTRGLIGAAGSCVAGGDCAAGSLGEGTDGGGRDVTGGLAFVGGAAGIQGSPSAARPGLMTLYICRGCGRDVEEYRTACPKCGQPTPEVGE